MLGFLKITARFNDFAMKTHRIQHIVVFVAMIYCSKWIQSKVPQGERHMGWSPEEARCKLPRVLSRWVTQDALNFPSKELWNAVYWGSSLEPQCQAFSWGLVTEALVALQYQNSRLPQVQHEPYCLHKRFRCNEPLSLGNSNPTSLVSRC